MRNWLVLGLAFLGYNWLNSQKKAIETIGFQIADLSMDWPRGYKLNIEFTNPTSNEISLDYVNIDLSYKGRMFTKINRTQVEIEAGTNKYWYNGTLNLLAIGSIIPELIS